MNQSSLTPLICLDYDPIDYWFFVPLICHCFVRYLQSAALALDDLMLPRLAISNSRRSTPGNELVSPERENNSHPNTGRLRYDLTKGFYQQKLDNFFNVANPGNTSDPVDF